jgi:hypothetical protein
MSGRLARLLGKDPGGTLHGDASPPGQEGGATPVAVPTGGRGGVVTRRVRPLTDRRDHR